MAGHAAASNQKLLAMLHQIIAVEIPPTMLVVRDVLSLVVVAMVVACAQSTPGTPADIRHPSASETPDPPDFQRLRGQMGVCVSDVGLADLTAA